jgi:hypothetical protein
MTDQEQIELDKLLAFRKAGGYLTLTQTQRLAALRALKLKQARSTKNDQTKRDYRLCISSK